MVIHRRIMPKKSRKATSMWRLIVEFLMSLILYGPF